MIFGILFSSWQVTNEVCILFGSDNFEKGYGYWTWKILSNIQFPHFFGHDWRLKQFYSYHKTYNVEYGCIISRGHHKIPQHLNSKREKHHYGYQWPQFLSPVITYLILKTLGEYCRLIPLTQPKIAFFQSIKLKSVKSPHQLYLHFDIISDNILKFEYLKIGCLVLSLLICGYCLAWRSSIEENIAKVKLKHVMI